MSFSHKQDSEPLWRRMIIFGTVMIMCVAIGTIMLPLTTDAWFFNVAQAQDTAATGATVAAQTTDNAQTVELLSPSVAYSAGGFAIDPNAVATFDNSGTSLLPQIGTDGTLADVTGQSDSGSVQIYTVAQGDTVASIAAKFNVTGNTIRFDNDMNESDTISVGDTLVIVPISGVSYVVKSGDTIASIEKNLKITSNDDVAAFLVFNNLEQTGSLSVGQVLITPFNNSAQSSSSSSSKSTKSKSSSNAASHYVFHGSDAGIGSTALMIHIPTVSTIVKNYFIKPIPCPMTQGRHDLYAVDLSCGAIGTPIRAAADGIIMYAKYGNNGGYGNLIIMKHPNGMLTFYAHIKPNGFVVKQGQSVAQGTVIAYVGSTGESTGPHLHFEVRGGGNPGFDYSGNSWKK